MGDVGDALTVLRAKRGKLVVDLSSDDLLRLIADRHAEDVFVPQCKDGPTQGYGPKLRVLDAWAMRKSWSQWSTVGYEIKVSRDDFDPMRRRVEKAERAAHHDERLVSVLRELGLDPIRPDEHTAARLLKSTVPCPTCGPETRGAA